MFNFWVKGKYIPSNFHLLLLVNNLISLCDQKLLFISFLLYDTALWHFTTAALANCHQLSIWSQDKFIFSTALEVRSPVGLEGLSVSGLTKQKLRCQLTWTFIKELWNRICFQVYSSYRQNSIQCVCRTEFPVPLLAIRQMPVFVLAHIHS